MTTFHIWIGAGLMVAAGCASAGDDRDEVESGSTGQVQQAACSTVSLVASPRLVAPGDPVALFANAFCNVGESASYRFLHRAPGANQFTQIRGWGSSSYVWSTTGQSDGGHQLKVQARALGSGTSFESADNFVVDIGNTCYRITSFNVSPAGSAFVGTPVDLSATSECSAGETPEYQFLLRNVASDQTTLLRSWGGSSYQWDTTKGIPDDYELVVQVRAVGNLSLKEASRREFFTLEVDGTLDIDGDGWTPNDGDCCEYDAQCGVAADVNPGAFEVLVNGVDDDCDLTIDGSQPVCSPSPIFTNVTPVQLAQAMDLCQLTTLNPPLSQRRWGLISAELLNADGTAPGTVRNGQMINSQSAVLADYGVGGVLPLRGATMLGFSTGTMRDQADPGYVSPAPGTDFLAYGFPPPEYVNPHGGALPGTMSCIGSCPGGTGANDSIRLRLTVRVPTNAHAVRFSTRFFSSEYFWQCTAYNDYALALLTTGAPGIPSDKNVVFDADGEPMTINSEFVKICNASGCKTCPLGTSAFAGTGLDLANGGGTAWLHTTAPVVPGETMALDLTIFDVSDNGYDSIALFDDFGWDVPSVTAPSTME